MLSSLVHIGRERPALTLGRIVGNWLRPLTPEQLSDVEVSPLGSGLRWDAFDIDLDVAGLLLSSIGRTEKAREFGRLAGSAKSAAKTRAARANGAKGGRPRKVRARGR
jgi:hypothetical protein